jgi:hypothetical protein
LADNPHRASDDDRAADASRLVVPYPFGHELTGYQVQDLRVTLDKAKAAGARILSAPYTTSERTSAVVEFPGGYIAEVHSLTALDS